MEYRKLPHGIENEKFSVLGLGMGGIGKTPADEIEAIIRKAIENGINFLTFALREHRMLQLAKPFEISATKYFYRFISARSMTKTANTVGAEISIQ